MFGHEHMDGIQCIHIRPVWVYCRVCVCSSSMSGMTKTPLFWATSAAIQNLARPLLLFYCVILPQCFAELVAQVGVNKIRQIKRDKKDFFLTSIPEMTFC